ncbi:hypothetical protein CGRA01v4_14148 [Colletotrichum graminicola]|uniref:Uncharacterized protein n=1 Tax=Colletotrichum graminicola (strain M1.001 / M2 / FGSC 10212) TaxID=645133 RepID=E3R131_COLGM|nr:uncharacterized protein GLRG_11965 [Colletotrichum graminicola M1.001]EFQ36819.1 hypothetical protein GLRG_11965 [Colletotrichum graminicola M1.001]WDK22857.1 hypothetical protein CGRA01v4_14148 [Colletotrichum graminicola]
MKTLHLTLPGLQIAAAAFFAATAKAMPLSTDDAGVVGAIEKRDVTQLSGKSLLAEEPSNDTEQSDKIPTVEVESSDLVVRQAIGNSPSGLISGGFGGPVHARCDSDDDSCGG